MKLFCRCYTGELGNDPERKLSLPDPILPSGNPPSSYLGYAVNMINLDVEHLETRTETSQSLRETLFYCLFGELQVYETREYMKMAKACIMLQLLNIDILFFSMVKLGGNTISYSVGFSSLVLFYKMKPNGSWSC